MMPAEWEPQDAILLAWPHRGTDWNYMLDEAQACFKNVVAAVAREMRVVVVAPHPDEVMALLGDIDNVDNIICQAIDTNDTWARDFGPISVVDGGNKLMLDFKFNAWGMKFAACRDNLICRAMAENGIFDAQYVNCQDIVLEGGSVESDGQGTILTTSRCLLSPNRNGALKKDDIERVLMHRLGARKVLWLDYGELKGDDTDAHIDTLARFAPGNTILYIESNNADDDQHESLRLMQQQLKTFGNARGERFNLVPLPCPDAIFDEDGNRLPATYANFLITNNQVLVPIYGQQENDRLAIDIIGKVFSTRTVVGINCNALIKQHGSLHCITMQIPNKFLKQ